MLVPYSPRKVECLLSPKLPSVDGHPESNMAFELGKPVSVALSDGTSLRGFVHAEDKGAGLVCLELIPSSDVTLLSTCNVKSVAPISDLSENRKWPSNRELLRLISLLDKLRLHRSGID